MATNTDLHKAPAQEIEDVRVADEMEQSYIDYAMSVIVGRSLPDVRDGLKPVQRRILYAMHEEGISANSGHRKSSSVVGETMGDYHPHGDSAIYDALVRMAQPFSLRHPLVDGQGNFGSIDDDPPAAQRYTEARLTPLAEELLESIDRDTVDFEANYDDRLEEPTVLPAKFPNLLVNGASGIAVGLSTNIPPHNLGEVIDATVHLIDNPDATVEDLMEHVPGPDFPTGATIVGREGIYDAYTTGKGRLTVRADYDIVENESGGDQIIITEIPYQTNKSRLIETIAEKVKNKTFEGISDLRDESDRDGVRVVIDLKRGANTQVVENKLLDEVFEKTFSVHNLAIVDGQPRLMSLKETLEHFIDHRREVVQRRSQHELNEKEDRAHILEGRLKALNRVDDVVETIRNADDRDAAKQALETDYDFSEAQAQHIVRMQLGSLTSMEAAEVEDEYEQVEARIERLREILTNESELLAVIKDELRDIQTEYADDRRTQIVDAVGSVTREDLIPEEELVVMLSDDGYLKRMAVESFDTQNRGGKGVIGTNLKDGDRVKTVAQIHSHDRLFCITSNGDVHEIKGYEFPEYSRTARGEPGVNLFDGLGDDEQITAIAPAPRPTSSEDNEKHLTMVTRNGRLKRTPLTAFENIFSTGIRAITLEGDDEVVEATVTNGETDLVIGTSDGRAIRFPITDARPMGRSARGVNAVKLGATDHVTGLAAINREAAETTDLLTVCENGYGKRTALTEYRQQSRYGKGLIDIKTPPRNGAALTLHGVTADDDIIVMTEDGQIMRMAVADVSRVGRNTMGVTIMDLASSDQIADVAVVSQSSTPSAPIDDA